MHDPIFDIFREEAREHLKSLEQGFLDLETNVELAHREQLVDKMFRHAHNIKGDARALGIDDLQQAAGVLEGHLEQLRDHPESIQGAVIEAGLQELDEVMRIYEDWQQTSFPELIPEISTVSAAESPAGTDAGPASQPSAGDFQSASPLWIEESLAVRVPAERLDRMLNLVGEVRVLQRSDAETQHQLKDLRGRLERLADRPEREWRSLLEGAFDQVRRIETTLHQQQSREQVLMQSLEADISAARLLPLTMLADSLRRPVRDLARSLGKEVRYEVDVGNVLLDKGVLESLRTPLLHLIRNAVDHGIETPAAREAAGKPAQGVIRLLARRRGEKVDIQVSDDGAGPDFQKIRQKLVARDEYGPEEVQQLSEGELAQRLFQPGFSTAEVGEISGRGVGLDVVRDALQRIQGRIELTAEAGRGSTFSLILPVTISTVRVLTVWCNGQSFGLPSESILKTGRTRPSEIRTLKGTTVLTLDGEAVRWTTLASLLRFDRALADIAHASLQYVIVQQEGRSIAIHVDEIDEEREVLLKPLEFPLTARPGILGGTIRPDGSVQLVLDLTAELFQESRAPVSPIAPGDSHAPPRILVVDDSPTTRALLKSIFTTEGYQVNTAVDGLDALEQLQLSRPDLVVCDFEMPRLNGVDLTRQIKAKWKLPVILVTGREQPHHRQEGLEAGADAYLVKSTFRGEGLLELVRQFVKE